MTDKTKAEKLKWPSRILAFGRKHFLRAVVAQGSRCLHPCRRRRFESFEFGGYFQQRAGKNGFCLLHEHVKHLRLVLSAGSLSVSMTQG